MAQAGLLDLPVVYLDSMLHMSPGRLAARLEDVLSPILNKGRRVVLAYGDCCSQMADWESLPGVARVDGMNCCEMLLGREDYRALRREGAFFLLPEWTLRWREIFATELGLTRENASGLMRDMHRKLIYLDTGTMPVPESALTECSQYCGLPFEVRRVELRHFAGAIREAQSRLEAKQTLL